MQAADAIVLVDAAVGELPVGAALVGAGLVDGHGPAAPLDLHPEEAVEVHVEARAERGSDGHPVGARRLAVEVAGADLVGRAAAVGARVEVRALLDAEEDDAGLQVEVRVDEELLEERELAAERDEVELRTGRAGGLGELVAEAGARGQREAV